MSIKTELDSAWTEWMREKNSQNKLTQGGTWRRDNPGEWTQLQAYRNGGARPNLASITGKQMVFETAAWLLAGGAPPPPPPTPTVKPSIPTGLTATAGNGQVVLSWNANPAGDQVDDYQVYRNDTLLADDLTGTSYAATGLTNGTQYSFRISAHNVVGYGDWTAAVNATPTAPVATPVYPSNTLYPSEVN